VEIAGRVLKELYDSVSHNLEELKNLWGAQLPLGSSTFVLSFDVNREFGDERRCFLNEGCACAILADSNLKIATRVGKTFLKEGEFTAVAAVVCQLGNLEAVGRCHVTTVEAAVDNCN
jgi:hypothetical protein